jgi:signal transduction histidine kinase
VQERVNVDSLATRLQAMLAVSRALVAGGQLGSTLDKIAAQACAVASAYASSILELTGDRRFRIVGSHGLTPEYRKMLHDWPTQLMPGRGPSGLAVELGAPVVSHDFQNDPRFSDWAAMPHRQRWQALAAFPLIVNETVLGALVLYRTEAVGWSDAEIHLLNFVAEHAAVAVRAAQLIDEQQRQVVALERLVRGLREQAHEHSNRLHTIAGLLALGDLQEALGFVESVTHAQLSDGQALDGVPHTALGVIVAIESALARQRSIELEADLSSSLQQTALSDAQMVTIVGNLLDNALDAVAAMPDDRRRVRLSILERPAHAEIRVRDWGPGVGVSDPFARGVSDKSGHAGVGLAIVEDAVIAAYGEIQVERLADGTEFVVALPLIGSSAGSDGGLRIMRGLASFGLRKP